MSDQSILRRAGAKLAQLIRRTLDPGAVANRYQLYSKLVGGVTQLFGQSSDGNVHQLSGGVDSWNLLTTTDEFTTTSGTPVAILPPTGDVLRFTPVANARYAVRAGVILSSTVAGIAPQMSIIWPTSLAGFGGGTIIQPNTVSAIVVTCVTQGVTTSSILASLPSTTDGYEAIVEITFTTGAGPTGDFALAVETETAGNAVAVRAGSWMEYRRLS